ncbi:hypothetical protein HDV06_001346 [Boothiomyces sp. JEL0866]|nr:hypothetical protein HDV06_001346 [Boothiomyces sp. JEL0866]
MVTIYLATGSVKIARIKQVSTFLAVYNTVWTVLFSMQLSNLSKAIPKLLIHKRLDIRLYNAFISKFPRSTRRKDLAVMILFMAIGFIANLSSVIFKLSTVSKNETQVFQQNFSNISPYTLPKFGNFSNLTSLLYTDMYLGTSNYFNVYTSVDPTLFQNDMDQLGYKGVQVFNNATVSDEYKYFDVLLNLPYNISSLASGYTSTIVTMDVKSLLTYSMCRDSGQLDHSYLSSRRVYSNCYCSQYRIPGVYDYYKSANTSICITKKGETCGDLLYMKYDVPAPPIIAEDPSEGPESSSIFAVNTPESLEFSSPDSEIKSF